MKKPRTRFHVGARGLSLDLRDLGCENAPTGLEPATVRIRFLSARLALPIDATSHSHTAATDGPNGPDRLFDTSRQVGGSPHFA
jgi:hypothetical protein